MSVIRTISHAATGILLIAASQAVRSAPANAQSLDDLPPCPELASGSAPFEAPFPSDCQGLNTTQTGLKWIEITTGPDGKPSPDDGSVVVVRYEAFLAENGTKVDSSYERGGLSVFRIGDVVEGWTQTLKMMTAGDEWLVDVPTELAYGEAGNTDRIPPLSDLVYRIRLEGFLDAEELAEIAPVVSSRAPILSSEGPDMAAWEANFPWDPDTEDLITLESGISYVVLNEGDEAAETAAPGDIVLVDYEGRVAETSEFFDSSWSRGKPTLLAVDGVIAGFSDALTHMRPGDWWIVHIPADLAYGDEGSGTDIPPGADLMFQIHLLAVNP